MQQHPRLASSAAHAAPSPRTFHAAFAVGPLLTVFGGRDAQNALCDSRRMHVWDARAAQWTAFDLAAAGVVDHRHLAATGRAHLALSHAQCLVYTDQVRARVQCLYMRFQNIVAQYALLHGLTCRGLTRSTHSNHPPLC
jgi:hypothetical protein